MDLYLLKVQQKDSLSVSDIASGPEMEEAEEQGLQITAAKGPGRPWHHSMVCLKLQQLKSRVYWMLSGFHLEFYSSVVNRITLL